MRLITCFAIFSLCLLTVVCDSGIIDREIDIGDYEYHWEAWNNQNVLDYQIVTDYYSSPAEMREGNLITVRNGIPESGSPEIPGLSFTTIPELYSWIKDVRNDNTPYFYFDSFKVDYNTEYHYPNEIIVKTRINSSNNSTDRWLITVMPLEEGELDIDIGDYEYHLEAWNSRNMLNYTIEVSRPWGNYAYHTFGAIEAYNVKNGILDINPVFYHEFISQATVSGIYSFIKEEEERIRNVFNGRERSYLHVKYNTEHHYPTQISLGIGHHFGYYERWEFTLTPEETE